MSLIQMREHGILIGGRAKICSLPDIWILYYINMYSLTLLCELICKRTELGGSDDNVVDRIADPEQLFTNKQKSE